MGGEAAAGKAEETGRRDRGTRGVRVAEGGVRVAERRKGTAHGKERKSRVSIK